MRAIASWPLLEQVVTCSEPQVLPIVAEWTVLLAWVDPDLRWR